MQHTPVLVVVFLNYFVSIVSGDCTFGRNDLVERDPWPAPGVFIDISTPASCTGFITRWNICHFNPRLYTMKNTLQIELQVWRFDQALQNGVLVGSNMATIDVPANPPDFRCVPVEIGKDQFINVTAGDFLGVQVPRDVLPVITSFVGPLPTLIHIPSIVPISTMITRRTQAVDLPNTAIFVTAEVEAIDGTFPSPTQATAEAEISAILTNITHNLPTTATPRSERTTQSGPFIPTADGAYYSTLVIEPIIKGQGKSALTIGVSVRIAILLAAVVITGIVLVVAVRRKMQRKKQSIQGATISMTESHVYEVGSKKITMPQNRMQGKESEEIQMSQNQCYGVGAEKIKMTQNRVYGIEAKGAQMSRNQAYGVGSEKIKMTQNRVYGIEAKGAQMSRNQAYGVGSGKMEMTQNQAYGIGSEQTRMQLNQAYGVGTENVQMTQNQSYRIGFEEIEMIQNQSYSIGTESTQNTRNQVYGVGAEKIQMARNQAGAEEIQMTRNQVYGMGVKKLQKTQNQVYGMGAEDIQLSLTWIKLHQASQKNDL